MFTQKVRIIGYDLNHNAVNSVVYDDPEQLLNITVKYFILALIIYINTN